MIGSWVMQNMSHLERAEALGKHLHIQLVESHLDGLEVVRQWGQVLETAGKGLEHQLLLMEVEHLPGIVATRLVMEIERQHGNLQVGTTATRRLIHMTALEHLMAEAEVELPHGTLVREHLTLVQIHLPLQFGTQVLKRRLVEDMEIRIPGTTRIIHPPTQPRGLPLLIMQPLLISRVTTPQTLQAYLHLHLALCRHPLHNQYRRLHHELGTRQHQAVWVLLLLAQRAKVIMMFLHLVENTVLQRLRVPHGIAEILMMRRTKVLGMRVPRLVLRRVEC